MSNRYARCLCFKTVPSAPDLPFFQDRGPNSKYQNTTCVVCNYNESAHVPAIQARPRSLICTQFMRGQGHEFDSYYCGCRGWD
jgi:hypothetical protein